MFFNQKKIKLANKIIMSWMENRANNGDFCLKLSVAENQISFSNSNQLYFRMASVSKVLTILLTLKLESERKLSLDDDIKKYIPLIKFGRKITIRHLLEHKSGISRDGKIFDFWSSAVFPDNNAILSLSMDNFKNFSREFKYSNLGYAILGVAIENICDKSYYDCLIEKVAGPLGFDILKDDSVKLKGFYVAPNKLIKDIVTSVPTKAFYPAFGAVISTRGAERLVLFICDADKIDEFFGVSRRKYFFKQNDNKLRLWENSNRKIYGHSGDFFGASSDLFIDPKNKIGGIILSNIRGEELSLISDGLLKTIYAIEDNLSFSRSVKYTEIEGVYKSRNKNLIAVSLGNGVLLFNPTDNSPLYDGMIVKKEKNGNFVLKFASSFAEVGEDVLFDKESISVGASKYKLFSKLTNKS